MFCAMVPLVRYFCRLACHLLVVSQRFLSVFNLTPSSYVQSSKRPFLSRDKLVLFRVEGTLFSVGADSTLIASPCGGTFCCSIVSSPPKS